MTDASRPALHDYALRLHLSATSVVDPSTLIYTMMIHGLGLLIMIQT
jgi:hypothetical protein